MRYVAGILGVALFAGTGLRAQQRDFLTQAEVDQLRTIQEPNDRLKLYVDFARVRVDQLNQLVFNNEKAGRSALIHDLLEDYEKVIEAIDTVADDALTRKKTIDVGISAVSSSEREMLAALQKIADSKPKDAARYQFALDEAIHTTEDSLELNEQDLQKRTADIAAREKREKAERDASLTPAEAAARKADDKKNAAAQPNKRKPPTLLRPGEKLPDK